MQKPLCLAAGSLLLLTLAGCASFEGQPAQPYESKRISVINDSISKYDLDPKTAACTDEACRNQRISNWIEAVDYYYHAFEDQVSATGRGLDFASDVAVAATTAGATAVSGNHSKTVLAAIATFFGGTKTSFDKGVYGEQSIQVLKARMRALRQSVLGRVTKGLHEPIEVYTMADAKIDLNAYFEAGSLDAAIADIQRDTKTQSDQAEKIIKKQRNKVLLKDLSEDKANDIENDLTAEGATVNKIKQPDNKFTIRAVMPDDTKDTPPPQ